MARGRDQREPMERLVRIAAALSQAPQHGVHVDRLVAVAGFERTESGREQVQRELRHLRRQGWEIVNLAGEGDGATYRMETVDNRLKVRLTLPQAAALQRAALVARRSDLVERLGLAQDGSLPDLPDLPVDVRLARDETAIDGVLEALRHRARLRFRYKGVERLTHPQSVRQHNGIWYLRAVQEGEDLTKTFAVARMGDVEIGPPGSGRLVPDVRHAGLHPLRWEVDSPVEAVVRAEAVFRPDVVRWLMDPASEAETDGVVEMRYRVTNRGAFRNRLYELGARVELVGPAEVRDEMLAELAALAAAGPR